MKKYFLAGASLALLLFGCKKDGEGEGNGTTPVTTTVEEDKANLTAAMDEIVTCLGTMKNGAMMNSMVAFTGLSDGEALKEEFIEAIFAKMGDAIGEVEVPDDSKFYFDSYTGTWAYNSTDSTWNRSNTPSDKIVVQFPSDDAQTSNNVEATLSGYVDEKYVFDLEDVWLPKAFSLSVTKDGTKIGGIDLDGLALEQSNDVVIPTLVSGSVFLAPFTFSIDGERVTSTEVEASIGLDDGTRCEYSMSSKLKLKHDDYENIMDEDFVSIEGSVGHNSMMVKYFVDIAKIMEYESANDEMTVDVVNDNIDFDVLMNNTEIGNLILKENSAEEVEVHMVYKDGTSENTSVYYEPFIEDVEALFSDLTGPWDEEEVQ